MAGLAETASTGIPTDPGPWGGGAPALCVVDGAAHPETAARAAAGAPLRVGLIGGGRAASALARALRAGAPENEIAIARRGATAAALGEALGVTPLDAAEVLGRADVTLLAVPDDAIGPVAMELAATAPPGEGRVVAHLSGSLEHGVLAALACHGYAAGAIHPLQVLSGGALPPGTTFAVEGQEAALPVLSRLVADLGGIELRLPEGARAEYHAAATIAANLGMTLLAEALDLLEGAGVDRARAQAGLIALLQGGLAATAERGLPAALTGPVSRGDADTVRRHLALLGRDPRLLDAYRSASVLALRQALKDGRPQDAGAAARVAGLLGADLNDMEASS